MRRSSIERVHYLYTISAVPQTCDLGFGTYGGLGILVRASDLLLLLERLWGYFEKINRARATVIGRLLNDLMEKVLKP